MSNKRTRQRQTSPASRQANIRGRQETSQTTAGRFANADTTFAAGSADGEEEYAVSGRGGGQKRADAWTIGGTIIGGLALLGSLLAGVLWVGWYVSKADTALTSVQSDVAQVKETVKKLTDESTKQSGRLERMEDFVAKILRDVRRRASLPEKRSDN